MNGDNGIAGPAAGLLEPSPRLAPRSGGRGGAGIPTSLLVVGPQVLTSGPPDARVRLTGPGSLGPAPRSLQWAWPACCLRPSEFECANQPLRRHAARCSRSAGAGGVRRAFVESAAGRRGGLPSQVRSLPRERRESGSALGCAPAPASAGHRRVPAGWCHGGRRSRNAAGRRPSGGVLPRKQRGRAVRARSGTLP